MTSASFKTWCGKTTSVPAVALGTAFLQRPDVHASGVWAEEFGCAPPWSEVARLSARFHIALHDAARPWQWPSEVAYTSEVERRVGWFRDVLPGVRRYIGILRDEEAGTRGQSCPVLTTAVLDHARRSQRPVYVRGCLNFSLVCNWLRAGGVEPADGTTDVEAMQAEVIADFRSARITSLCDQSFNLHRDIFVLRVAHRRSHAGLHMTAAHHRAHAAYDLALMQEIIECLADDEAALATKWRARLRSRRTTKNIALGRFSRRVARKRSVSKGVVKAAGPKRRLTRKQPYRECGV